MPIFYRVLLFFSICIGLLIVFSSRAMATAGMAESSADYYYNNFTQLVWTHGDVCIGKTTPHNKECFYLRANFMFTPLEAISIPQDKSSPFVIAQQFRDDHWIVFDLKTREKLLTTPDYHKALKVWNSLGFRDPTLVTTDDIRKTFQETEESKERNKPHWQLIVLGAFFFIVILVTVGTGLVIIGPIGWIVVALILILFYLKLWPNINWP